MPPGRQLVESRGPWQDLTVPPEETHAQPVRKLILYSTDGCQLCDDALDLLLELDAARGFALEVIDIALVDELVERYGEDIPVIEAPGARDDAAVLRAPFDRHALETWLAGISETE